MVKFDPLMFPEKIPDDVIQIVDPPFALMFEDVLLAMV
jgi:hypothetical protein